MPTLIMLVRRLGWVGIKTDHRQTLCGLVQQTLINIVLVVKIKTIYRDALQLEAASRRASRSGFNHSGPFNATISQPL